jgi:hypothetical protein
MTRSLAVPVCAVNGWFGRAGSEPGCAGGSLACPPVIGIGAAQALISVRVPRTACGEIRDSPSPSSPRAINR